MFSSQQTPLIQNGHSCEYQQCPNISRAIEKTCNPKIEKLMLYAAQVTLGRWSWEILGKRD